MKIFKSTLVLSALLISACGGGSSSSQDSADEAFGCITGEVSGGIATLTNSCDIDVNVRLFASFESEDSANSRPPVLVPANQTVSGVQGPTGFGPTIAACAAPDIPELETVDFSLQFVDCD